MTRSTRRFYSESGWGGGEACLLADGASRCGWRLPRALVSFDAERALRPCGPCARAPTARPWAAASTCRGVQRAPDTLSGCRLVTRGWARGCGYRAILDWITSPGRVSTQMWPLPRIPRRAQRIRARNPRERPRRSAAARRTTRIKFRPFDVEGTGRPSCVEARGRARSAGAQAGGSSSAACHRAGRRVPSAGVARGGSTPSGPAGRRVPWREHGAPFAHDGGRIGARLWSVEASRGSAANASLGSIS